MKNTLKAELHQAFHNRFFYISFFLMLAFSVFGVFFMELPRESGFDLWRQYRFDENGAPLTTLFLPATANGSAAMLVNLRPPPFIFSCF